MAKLKERLSVTKRVDQTVGINRFNVGKFKDEETKLQYQVQISNRFDALITSNENADEVDINDMWENIRDNQSSSWGEHRLLRSKEK